MAEPHDLDEIRRQFRRDPLFEGLASARALGVLDRIVDHAAFPGASDLHALSMLAILLRLTRPTRVLELGTLVGFSTIVLADILSRQDGTLVTVDPDARARELARGWVDEAGLTEAVTFLAGATTDAATQAAIADHGPYRLVYLDSSHAYTTTLAELDLVFETGRWLEEHGLLVLHDAGEYAARFDRSGGGGVGRAIREWVAERDGRYDVLVLEPPLWPAACGLALLTRRQP